MAQLLGFINPGQLGMARAAPRLGATGGLAQAQASAPPPRARQLGANAPRAVAAALAGGATAMLRRAGPARRGLASRHTGGEAAEGSAEAARPPPAWPPPQAVPADPRAPEWAAAAGSTRPEGGRPNFGRRLLALLGGLAALPAAAWADLVRFDEGSRCSECAGTGIVTCVTCKGSGQFKMLGLPEGSTEAMYQFVDCPDCDGVGSRLCQRCYGTGLPAKMLKGFLRDPSFKKILYRLKRKKIDLDTLPKVQEEVAEAIAEIERRKKELAVAV